MTTTPPAEIGMPLSEVDTPALLLDLDAFERNMDRLAKAVAGTGVRLRPHAKTHKCPNIARAQIARGAVGVCCQKVGEAEAMVAGGVGDVYVSNEIVGRSKLERLAALAKQATISVAVDNLDNVAQIEAAAAKFNARINVYVEIAAGMRRCGVDPGPEAVALARAVTQAPHLRFAGLQAYHGSAQHIRSHEDRRKAIEIAGEAATTTRDLLRQAGIDTPLITGAGTGTFRFEMGSGIWGELQCGSYVFMDADYGRNLDKDGHAGTEFEHSLFIWATVMSRPTRDRAVLDVGLKGVATDCGMPLLDGVANVTFERASDDHGTLKVGDTNHPLAVGDKIRLIPGHCDPTVNLYDWYVGVRDGRVEALWPITARGMLR
jgi:D-serine deaminase-like pyridoxal phosphate-dependent protein